MFNKKHVAMVVAEFLGTGLLTLLVLSVQRSTIGVPFFVALIGGVTLMAMVFALGDVSGAYLNPAVSLALWTARRLSTLRTVFLVAAEMLGAWVAYYVYTYFVNNKLAPIGGHFTGRTLAAEAVGAGILGLVWASASFSKWSRTATAPIVGVGLFVAMVAASAAGLGLVNPALALGVRAWVWGTYVVGPLIGAIVGVNLYGLLFAEGGKFNFNFMPKMAMASSAKKTVAKSSSNKKSK